MLGSAKTIKITRDSTTIIEGKGSKEQIELRMRELRNQINESTSDTDTTLLSERLANLSGGVALLKVGAATEIEMKEKKLRIEDALSATKSATQEGIVAGGGTALLSVHPALSSFVETLDGDEKPEPQSFLKPSKPQSIKSLKTQGLSLQQL